MMSVGVEITSYLLQQTVRRKSGTYDESHSQLDDVRVTQRPHVVYLPLHSHFCPRCDDRLLGEKLHCDFLASDGVVGH